MSYSWLTVRSGSSNPSSLKFQALMNKQSIFENELFKPETTQLNIISTHTEDLVLIQDPFMFRKLRAKTTHYFGGFEPDGVILRCWIRFNHIAKLMKDYAFCEMGVGGYHHIEPYGNPLLCEGPDDGVKGNTIVCKINYKPENIDYFRIANPDECLIGVTEQTAGLSLAFEFQLDEDPVQHNGEDPTLWFHVDDPTGDYGTMLKVGVNRELKFFVRNAGTTYNFISENNKITPGTYHLACVTYNPTGNVMTMKVDDILCVDSANETPTFPASHDNSVFMGIGTNQNAGRLVGRLKDARWYRNLIFWNEHQTNLWNNKRSICAANMINFDGVDDYIDLTNDATLWSQSLTKFSFSFWIYPTVGWDGQDRRVVQHGIASNQGFGTYIDTAITGRINFRIKNSVGATLTATNNGLILNKWNHVTSVYDNSLGSANLKIYVDGVVGINANLTETVNQSIALRLGDSPTHFKGYMKDFRWWTTIPLTPAQIIAVRDNRTDAPLPNYWLKLNAGNGSPIDYITRTKQATLTNGALWVIGASPYPTAFGSLAVAGYSRFNDTIDTGGYDTTGFDTTGFDTT